MAATKFTVKHILAHTLLPGGGDPTARGKGTPFCIYVCKDDGSLWLSDAEGNMCCLSDILLGKSLPVRLGKSLPVRAFPAQGCAGRDGAPGRDGADGKPGRDGADSVVPGQASTVPGPQGPPGQSIRGEKGDPGSDTAVVLAEVRQALAEIRRQLVPLNAEYHRFLKEQADFNARMAERVAAIRKRG